jgi:glutamate-1-semialdehyde 2,1-aminomutase
MSAIRLARAFTSRDLIVKFSGCYHGHADHLLVAAGSGLATFGRPSSAGVPEAFTACTRVLPLDDEAAVEALFAQDGARIAAVIIEPVPANHGLLLQRKEFLNTLRRITSQHGTLLIFDEVISGFRLARGGVAELTGIVPDLATFGKVIGGGMPVGAFGGSRKIMSRLAPDGDTYQAGTLSGNPVAMAAGSATLEVLIKHNGWQKLEALGAELETLLGPVLAKAGFPVHLVRQGSLFWMSFHEKGAPRTAAPLADAASQRFSALFHAMLDRGVYLPPSAYEACFLSLAHTSADLRTFTQALSDSFQAIA